MIYGQDPPTLLRIDPQYEIDMDLCVLLIERDQILEQLKAHLHKAQSKMKDYVDCGRREVEYNVGDYVYLKL